MRTVQEIERLLAVSPEAGLRSEDVPASRAKFGGNRLTPLPREPIWKKFLAKFDEPIIKILLAAALLSMIVDLSSAYVVGSIAICLSAMLIAGTYYLGRKEWVPTMLFLLAVIIWPAGWLATGHASIDGLAVMIAVILATGVAFISEYRSDREFALLNSEKESLRVKVLRGGTFHTIPLEEVVVGDLVVLEMGDEVPADGRLLKATELYVDQSLMTGESEPVHKSGVRSQESGVRSQESDSFDNPGCLFRGTQVVDGVGHMLVTDVGDTTYLGQIARRLGTEEPDAAEATEEKRVQRKLTVSKELTPLQHKLEKLAGLISKVGYVAAAAIFVALLVRGIFTGEVGATAGFLNSASTVLGYFMYMVIIIVVAVPEGLPMSVTVSLALAMRKMTRANSLVRQLVACETIGSATVICSDKTGTLTQNKMQVVRLSWEGEVFDVKAHGLQSVGVFTTPLHWMVLNAAVNSTANLEEKDGKLLTVGNSTEGALLHWLRDGGVSYEALRLQYEPLYQIHFSSERKRMTSVVSAGDRVTTLVKGAPEWLLGQCTHFLAADGETRELTPDMRMAIQARLRESAAQSMRTLAFAHVHLAADCPTDENGLHAIRDTLETGLIYTGFLAIRDPLRDDVKGAVAECRDAGIEVKMITGDNVETARAIGAEIGLLDRPDAIVMSSPEFNDLSDEELKKRLPYLRILARAKPLDKYRMVKLLQELGEVVAVTGDGTNDAPALKKADVGLAMGQCGTEVAKEASKIVLLDDAFSTIVKAVHWGRSLYENIQRFIQFQLTINVSALAIAFLGPFFGVKPPFTILQLLWINVIMDTLASIALCSEPPRPGLMRLPPKRRDDNILTPSMRRNILVTAGFLVVVMMGLLLVMKGSPDKPGWFAGLGHWSPEFPELTVRQVSIFFTVFVLFQVWNEINCRSLVPEVSGFTGIRRNPTFLGILAVIVLGQVLIITFGGEVFKVAPLGLLDWVLMGVGTATILLFAEVVRRLRRP